MYTILFMTSDSHLMSQPAATLVATLYQKGGAHWPSPKSRKMT